MTYIGRERKRERGKERERLREGKAGIDKNIERARAGSSINQIPIYSKI